MQCRRQGPPGPTRCCPARPCAKRYTLTVSPTRCSRCSHPHHAAVQRRTFTACFFGSALETKPAANKFLSTSITDTSLEYTLCSSQHPPVIAVLAHQRFPHRCRGAGCSAPSFPPTSSSAAPVLLRAPQGPSAPRTGHQRTLRPRPPLFTARPAPEPRDRRRSTVQLSATGRSLRRGAKGRETIAGANLPLHTPRRRPGRSSTAQKHFRIRGPAPASRGARHRAAEGAGPRGGGRGRAGGGAIVTAARREGGGGGPG